MVNELVPLDTVRQMLRETAEQWSEPPEVHFKRHRIPPMSSQYIGPDDWLQVNVYTTAPTTGLTLAMRYLDAKGEMHYHKESLDGANLNTLTPHVFKLAEGWLLGLTISNLGGGLADDACMIVVGLQQTGAAGVPMHTLLAQEFVSNLLSVEWPPAYTRGPATSGMPAGVSKGDLAIYTGTTWTYFAANTAGNKLLQEDATGTASWVADIPNIVLQAKVTLAAADILALKTTPIQLVAAPGANKVIVPHSWTLAFHPVATPYTVDGTTLLDLQLATSPVTVLVDVAGANLIDQAAATYAGGLANIAPALFAHDPTNKALQIQLAGTAATLGDGTLTVTVDYAIDPTV